MIKYSFKAKIWKYKGKAGWYFVTLPKVLSKKIRSRQGSSEEGWGRLKTNATIKTSTWKTSIWYDTKSQAYLLPIKTLIRKKENLTEGSPLQATLAFEPNPKEKRLGNWLVNSPTQD